MNRILDRHVSRQHIGKASNFSPTHGIGLARDREWAHARTPDASGQQGGN